MAEKMRSVNTKFWDDPFIENLSSSEKLLFIYLLTNPLTNLLGVYEITLKRISYDTGLNKETISKGLESFGKHKKAFYTPDNFVILPNWLKNQRLNTNMKIAVAREFDILPNNLKHSILNNGCERLGNDSEGFRMVMESLGKYEIEIESEIEKEKEIENDNIIIFNLFRQSYPGTKRGSQIEFENFVKHHKDWRDILPILLERLNYQKEARQVRKGNKLFVPEWKNLQSWINQRSWEDIINTTE